MKPLLGPPRNLAPVPFATRAAAFAGRLVNRNDTLSQLSTYESVSTLHAIVRSISVSTSMICWDFYRLPRSGDVEGRVKITKPHPAKALWERPNPFQTRMQFVHAQQQHQELAGESDWLVVRDDRLGIPSELWLARPDRMVPVPHPTDFMSGWYYHGPDGDRIPLGLDEVVQLKSGPNPIDPYRGMSPVPSAMIDLNAWELAAQWNLNFFHNSAQPGGIIELSKPLKDAEFNELRDRWRAQHQGVANAHRVALLEHGKWVDRNYTNRDMEFTALRALSSEIIREAFAFPKPMLGGTEDVNKAAAWAAQVIFARWLLKPRLEEIKQAWNVHILPMFGSFGDRIMVDYDNPVPEDREDDDRERTSVSTAVSQLAAAGAYLPDVLTAYGLPAMRRTADVEAEAEPEAEPDPGDPGEPAEPGVEPPPAPAEGDDAAEDVRRMLREARNAAARRRR